MTRMIPERRAEIEAWLEEQHPLSHFPRELRDELKAVEAENTALRDAVEHVRICPYTCHAPGSIHANDCEGWSRHRWEVANEALAKLGGETDGG